MSENTTTKVLKNTKIQLFGDISILKQHLEIYNHENNNTEINKAVTYEFPFFGNHYHFQELNIIVKNALFKINPNEEVKLLCSQPTLQEGYYPFIETEPDPENVLTLINPYKNETIVDQIIEQILPMVKLDAMELYDNHYDEPSKNPRDLTQSLKNIQLIIEKFLLSKNLEIKDNKKMKFL